MTNFSPKWKAVSLRSVWPFQFTNFLGENKLSIANWARHFNRHGEMCSEIQHYGNEQWRNDKLPLSTVRSFSHASCELLCLYVNLPYKNSPMIFCGFEWRLRQQKRVVKNWKSWNLSNESFGLNLAMQKNDNQCWDDLPWPPTLHPLCRVHHRR